jgi:hypothetical protein
MKRIIAFIVSAAINASTIPAVASECNSSKYTDASRLRQATLRSQPNAADNACRAYAASFYGSVRQRQATAMCVDGARNLAELDSKINALNDLLATKCGSWASLLTREAIPEVRG